MQNPQHTGEQAYAEDVCRKPLYHDGTPRPQWAELGEVAQWSWNKNPTPREFICRSLVHDAAE